MKQTTLPADIVNFHANGWDDQTIKFMFLVTWKIKESSNIIYEVIYTIYFELDKANSYMNKIFDYRMTEIDYHILETYYLILRFKLANFTLKFFFWSNFF